jgi:hypothetical protein
MIMILLMIFPLGHAAQKDQDHDHDHEQEWLGLPG